jgi:hemerythrin
MTMAVDRRQLDRGADDTMEGGTPADRANADPLIYADWSEALEMGLPLIDAQHKRFFELAASFQGNGDEVRVIKTLAILSDYIRSHLRDEEALMAAAHYPGLEAHCRQHAEFRSLLAALLGRARQMSLDAIADEVKFLVNGWFYRHIITVDFEYAPYLVPGHPGKPAAPKDVAA